ncbi:Mitochondrial carrier protein [Seminavis robusta]|uniref:Mitochondrial carrier protein n=1 Tax=Seminavis robusta TaxID=568900 RepID=A0A9N8EX39_9STRA|nr:Mitochondrial carrier protein [Seminavis robusta]|eukprot:Sro2207_g319110.1 Mitochondrial carrier protein (295) ;mRNA; r:11894-12778
MGGGSLAKEYPNEYFLAAFGAACLNYPLWRASAVGQSGFRVAAVSIGGVGIPATLTPYVYAFAPPYKGMVGVVLGMTWARAAIFWGSDRGKEFLQSHGVKNESISTLLPPLCVSTMVQCINQPIVRASITLQNPRFNCPDTVSAIKFIYEKYGLRGMWHGTSAGILKTVPKYCTAVVIKDYMEEVLPPVDPSSPTVDTDRLWRSAAKSATAGVAGAALTNPLDVIRNEMFKKNTPLLETVRNLYKELGRKFLVRGMGKNMIAVAIPVGSTIFFTDTLIQMSKNRQARKAQQQSA